MKRLDSIDMMRAAAIVFMVVCHFLIFLAPANGNYPCLYFFSNHLVGDFAAPFFLFLVGLSYTLSEERRYRVGQTFPMILRHSFLRGLIIFVVGLLFSLSVRGPKAIFEWDILPLIGVSLMLLPLLSRLPSLFLFITCMAIFLASPWAQQALNYESFWGTIYESEACVSRLFPNLLMDPANELTALLTPYDILIGFFVVGYFPFFPWVIFVIAGLLVGKHLSWNLVPWGLLFSLAGIAAAFYLTPFSFYPDSPSLLLLQLGITLLSFTGFQALFDRTPRKISYWKRLSHYSLTIYVLHHLAIYWPMKITGYVQGDIDKYYENATNELQAFLLALLFLVLLQPLLKAWDRIHGKYSLEYLLSSWVR